MRYGINAPGGRLQGLATAVEVREAGAVRRVTGGPVTTDLRVEPTPLGAVVTLRVTNGGDRPVTLHRLFPLIFDGESSLKLSAAGTAPWGVYKQGYQSWSYAGWRALDGRDIHPRSVFTRTAQADRSWPASRRPGVFQSESMLMLGRPSGGAVLLTGFISGARQFGRLELTGGSPLGRLEAWCEADGVEIKPGETLTAEPLLVLLAPEAEALEAYAGACAQTMTARVPERSPAVWCSWYYHFTNVRESDILAASASLKALRETHPIDVIQLDDGYQAAVGDWLAPNAKFPRGLAWLAQQIRSAGFTPGLWLAPFIAQSRSRLFQKHPDWFVKGKGGRPVSVGWNPNWNDVPYALDTTHPAVQGWLYGLFTTLAEAGFRYLKLDFIYGAAMPGVRHDRQATRASALRAGLEAIRRAVGEDVFLLGCGCPMLPAVGMVDGMRVGPDVAPSWRFKFRGLPVLQAEPGVPSARNALQVALSRQWMHGRLWANDPDSMILRVQESELTTDEARSLASVAALSGGIPSFSDPPGSLPPERLAWLGRTLPAARAGVQPLTLLAEPIPFLSVSHSRGWAVVLACNGEDRPRPLEVLWAALGLPAGADCHVYDCWQERYLGSHTGGIALEPLAPHACRVLAIRPAAAAGPVVVGTNLHLHPAEAVTSTRWDGYVLTVELSRTPAEITVVGEGHLCVPGATVDVERQGPLGERILWFEPDVSLLTHSITLEEGDLRLRPMLEADWPLLIRWENDPEVLYFAEDSAVTGRTVAEVQEIYRWVSQKAYLFIMEADGRPIGSCWLQQMNRGRILLQFPDKDLHRIDLAIGDKESWGRGYGTRAIRLLTDLAIRRHGADGVFGVEIGDYNPRSRRAFEKAGYTLYAVVDVEQPAKAQQTFDMVIWRQ